MRLRAHLQERISACGDYILSNDEDVRKYIGGKKLCIEIGCGKGGFILETAKRNPNTAFLAIELVSNVAILAAEKAKAEGVENLKFCMKDVKLLSSLVDDGSIDIIYLNFSDPWPKKKQAKRRLTHADFLKMYEKWLAHDGAIFFKTDNSKLFEFSLNSFCGEGYRLSNITFDLHGSDFEGNIMTEYEKKFSEEGKPIYRLEARKA